MSKILTITCHFERREESATAIGTHTYLTYLNWRKGEFTNVTLPPPNNEEKNPSNTLAMPSANES